MNNSRWEWPFTRGSGVGTVEGGSDRSQKVLVHKR